MSQAFVRENEEQWLHEVSASVNALASYLTRENNNILVYEKRYFINAADNIEMHEMSNGFTYARDKGGKWFVV